MSQQKNSSPTYDEFITWADRFGLVTKEWDSNTAIQFWTFFCHGWRERFAPSGDNSRDHAARHHASSSVNPLRSLAENETV